MKMKTISNVKLYDKSIDIQYVNDNCSTVEEPYKKTMLEYLKNTERRSSCTTEKVYDYFEKKYVDIPIVAYHDEFFYWDDRDIYYFEEYNLKLAEEFVNHVLKQTERS